MTGEGVHGTQRRGSFLQTPGVYDRLVHRDQTTITTPPQGASMDRNRRDFIAGSAALAAVPLAPAAWAADAKPRDGRE